MAYPDTEQTGERDGSSELTELFMIDTHCHLSLGSPSEQDFQHIWDEGVRGIFLAGYGPLEWDEQIRIAGMYSRFRWWRSFGLHPWWISSQKDERKVDEALHLLKQRISEAHGVGECGLDFSRTRDPGRRNLQIRVLREQIMLAAEQHLPLILHVVGAHGQARELLREHSCGKHQNFVRGVLHGFTGSLELAMAYARLGFLISFNAAALKACTGEGFFKLRDTIEGIPLEYILLETDAVYHHREPGHESRRPVHLWDVAHSIALCRGMSVEELVGISNANFGKLGLT